MGQGGGFGTGQRLVEQGSGFGTGLQFVGQGSGFATGLQFVGQSSSLWDRTSVCGTGLRRLWDRAAVCGTGQGFVGQDCDVSWAVLALGPRRLHHLLISTRLE